MTPAARVQAAIDVLDLWRSGTEGADRVLADWGRRNRYAGSGDRRAIADLVYGALRRWRSAGWVAGTGDEPDGRAAMIGALRLDGADLDSFFTGQRHAPPPLTRLEADGRTLDAAPRAVRLDLPDWLLPVLAETDAAALDRLRHRAPLFLRVNALKCSRGEAIAALTAEDIATAPGPLALGCLVVEDGAHRVARSRAYAEGLVEIQDAASQAVAMFASVSLGQTVLDFCPGGGGKTLALAAAMGNDGRLWAHDISAARLAQLPPRAERAGARVRLCDPGNTAPLKGACDLVLADAPCSGSGAWARNPDAKWRLTPNRLAELTRLQDEVLDGAADAVCAGGRLVYATCSMIPAENHARIAAFLARTSAFTLDEERRWTPLDGGDGFYAARLIRADGRSAQNALRSI